MNKFNLAILSALIFISNISQAHIAPLNTGYSTISEANGNSIRNEDLKETPWPSNVIKAFKYRQEYYKTFTGSTLETYSKITDDFPNVITFWSRKNKSWITLQNTQLSVSDDFPSDNTDEAIYSLSILQSRFEDQGFELSSSKMLRDTDTSAIGINKNALSQDELYTVVEIVMTQQIHNDTGHGGEISRPAATIAITLIPTIKSGRLVFTNVSIFYTEES